MHIDCRVAAPLALAASHQVTSNHTGNILSLAWLRETESESESPSPQFNFADYLKSNVLAAAQTCTSTSPGYIQVEASHWHDCAGRPFKLARHGTASASG
jgi:hypothetical protein